MKEIPLDQFSKQAAVLLEDVQNGRILVTRDGKPWAVVVGIENKDAEDLQLEASPDFWELIAERRREPSVSLKDVRAELLADE